MSTTYEVNFPVLAFTASTLIPFDAPSTGKLTKVLIAGGGNAKKFDVLCRNLVNTAYTLKYAQPILHQGTIRPVVYLNELEADVFVAKGDHVVVASTTSFNDADAVVLDRLDDGGLVLDTSGITAATPREGGAGTVTLNNSAAAAMHRIIAQLTTSSGGDAAYYGSAPFINRDPPLLFNSLRRRKLYLVSDANNSSVQVSLTFELPRGNN